MPRATIPYFEIDEFIEKQYPKPVFRRPQRESGTPKTVYDRSTGNFARIGYMVNVSYTRLTGFDNDLQPVYNFFFDTIFVPTNMKQSSL